jgi:hypothetical protein
VSLRFLLVKEMRLANMHNFTYIQQHLIEWCMTGYTNVLGVFVWPLIFTGVLGYVYLKNQSLLMVVAGILMIMAVFGNALLGVDAWINLLYVFTAIVVAALFLIFFVRRRT